MAPRSQYRLSGLQKSILQWLRSEQRRRHSTDNAMGIAYPELVRALDAGKAPVTTGLRQLMRRALVVVTLPRGGWTRYVHLTEEGETEAKALSQDERQQRPKPYLPDILTPVKGDRQQRRSMERRAPKRGSRRKDLYRRD